MNVVLRQPRRQVEVVGPMRVAKIFEVLDLVPESYLVIRGDELLTADDQVADDDTIELRPVISGG